MEIRVGCTTDRGNYRSKNQDAIMCSRKTVGDEVLAIACICDGIGSLKESEIASSMVVSGVENWFEGVYQYYPNVMGKLELLKDLEFTLQELNELVNEYEDTYQKKIGCTMSLILFINSDYYIYHVGDSRICLLREEMVQLTCDEVVLKIIDGREKTLLANYVGKTSHLSVCRECGQIQYGDIYILGSDGLFKLLKGDDVRTMMSTTKEDKDVQIASRKLIELVLERGERDNVSCAMVKFGS